MNRKPSTTRRNRAANQDVAGRQRTARKWVGMLAVVFATVAITWSWWGGSRDARTHDKAGQSPNGKAEQVLAPESFAQLDPPVARLISQQIARVNAGQNDAGPNNAAELAKLGLIYEANDLWQDALHTFQRAVAIRDDEPTWRYHVAMNAHEVGEFAVERTEIEWVIRHHPEFAPAQQRHGHERLESGDLASAAKAFEQVIRLKPKAAEGYVGLADVRLRENDVNAAIKLLQQALQRDRNYKVTHFLLGSALARAGRESEAARYLQFGMGGTIRYLQDPLSAEKERYALNLKARASRGMKLLVADKAKEAAKLLEEVLAEDPNNVTVMNNLAGAYVRLRRTPDAYALLQRAQASDDQKPSTYVNLANYAVMQKDYETALQHADRAVGLGPRSELAHRARASVLFYLGRFADALVNAHQATVLNPNNAAGLRQAADLAMRTENYADAVNYYEALTQLEPQDIASWVGLTKAAVGNQDVARARKAVAQAQQVAPNHPAVKRLVQVMSQ